MSLLYKTVIKYNVQIKKLSSLPSDGLTTEFFCSLIRAPVRRRKRLMWLESIF